MKKPLNFNNYIELYNHISKNHPEYLKGKTIIFQYVDVNDREYIKIKQFKISIRTLKAHCWDEIASSRLNKADIYALMDMLYMSPMTPERERLINLINKMKV